MASRIPVLMYHRIGDQTTPWDRHYSVSPRNFAKQMERLARNGYRACSLGDFVGWLNNAAALPEKSLLITFDDGFCGVHDHAFPVLRALGWPFTVFMVSGKVGQAADWDLPLQPTDRSRRLMERRSLEALLSGGASIESHGATHVDLTSLSDEHLAQEMTNSRDSLTSLSGHPVQTIAYPYGKYDARVIRFARAAGYQTGFSVNPGFNRRQTEQMELRRLDVFGTDSPSQLLRKVRFGSNDGSWDQDIRYLMRRLTDRAKRLASRSVP